MAELPRAAHRRGRAGWILASFLTMLMVIDLELWFAPVICRVVRLIGLSRRDGLARTPAFLMRSDHQVGGQKSRHFAP
jgi:hypothetical protein